MKKERNTRQEKFVRQNGTGILLFVIFVLHVGTFGVGIYMRTSARYKYGALLQVRLLMVFLLYVFSLKTQKFNIKFKKNSVWLFCAGLGKIQIHVGLNHPPIFYTDPQAPLESFLKAMARSFLIYFYLRCSSLF